MFKHRISFYIAILITTTTFCCLIIYRISPINRAPIIHILASSDINEHLSIFDNRASLLPQCRMYQYYDWLKPMYRQPFLSNHLCFTHVHKCGGTTVMNLFKYLYSNQYLDALYHPKDFYEWLFDLKDRDIMLFTFVRDPVDRFISAFYEMKRRHNEMNGNYRKSKESDLKEMRSLLNDMLALKERNEFPWKFDKHLWPQMLFLIDHRGEVLEYNYIGMMDNMEMVLPLFFEQYENVSSEIVSEFLKENIHRDSRSRKHDKVYAKYTEYVSRDDLNDQDERMIRSVYWIDYLCLFPEL